MARSVILKTSQGEVFAVLENVKEDETLLSVRQRVRETSPCDDFSFLLFGIPLKTKQESKTYVRDCWQRNMADGHFILEVKAQNATTETRKPKAYSEAPSSTVDATGSDASACSGASEHELNVAKVKHFSDAEIQDATKLFAKERMRFHNGMLKKIRMDESLSDWGPQELLGVIESSWVMKKTELLKLKVKEILSEDISSTTDCKGRDKVLMRNLNILEKAHFDVNQGYSKFAEEVGKNESERNSLENTFDDVFSALKKSQANLQKSIEAFTKKNTLQQPSVDQREGQASAPDMSLEDNEISFLADDIKIDYESD